MTTINMPCTINTCHHYHVLFCKKIITTWQSPPHDNHHHMTITTTYLQMSPNYNCVRPGDSFIWFDLYRYSLSKVSNQWLFPIPRKGFTKKHYQVLGNSWLWDEGVQTNNIPHTRGDHLLLCIPGETSIYELRPRGCELEVKVNNAKCQHCPMSTNSNVANFKFQTVNNVKCCQISTMSNACILHINLVHWSCNNFLNFFNAIKDLL